MTNSFAKGVLAFFLSATLSLSSFSPATLQAFADDPSSNPAAAQPVDETSNDPAPTQPADEPSSDPASVQPTEENQAQASLTAAPSIDSVASENILLDPTKKAASVDGTFKYDGESTLEFHYRDEFFYGPSTTYNPSLATMSGNMAWAGFNYTANGDYSVGSKLLQELSEKCGFTRFEANDYYKEIPGAHTVGVGIASKKITLPDGTQRTLITVTQRSGGYGSEWSSNTTLGTSGEAKGFAEGRDEVVRFLTYYLNKYKDVIGDSPKIWISGYSRGSAIGNLTGNFINCAIQTNNGNTALMNAFRPLARELNLKSEDVYCYGIEVPKGGVDNGPYPAENNDNLHVCVDPNDPVPYVAPSNWNFKWYGKVHDITTNSPYTDEVYIQELAKIDAGVAEEYRKSAMSKTFQPYQCSTLLKLKDFEFYKVDPKDSKVGTSFGSFTQKLMDGLTSACGKRSDYNSGLQKVVAVFSRIAMDDKNGKKNMKAIMDVFNEEVSGAQKWDLILGNFANASAAADWTIRGISVILGLAGFGLLPLTITEAMKAAGRSDAINVFKDIFLTLYQRGYITESEYKDLLDGFPDAFDTLILFVRNDNSNSFPLLATALTYGGDLATFHFPHYVAAHLHAEDPLFQQAEAEKPAYQLTLMPDQGEETVSPDVTVDVTSIDASGNKTVLAQVNNNTIYYTAAGLAAKDRIKAIQYPTGMLTVEVADTDATASVDFAISAPNENNLSGVTLRTTYDYYQPGHGMSSTRQDFENRTITFKDGDKLTLSCPSGNKECSIAWTFRLTPAFVDRTFKTIEGGSIEGKISYGATDQRPVVWDSIPDSHEVTFDVTLPDGYNKFELTTNPATKDNGSYIVGPDGTVKYTPLVTNTIDAATYFHSAKLYVVCTKTAHPTNFKMRLTESSVDAYGQKLQDLTSNIADGTWSDSSIAVQNKSKSTLTFYDLKEVFSSGVEIPAGDSITVWVTNGIVKNGDDKWILESWNCLTGNVDRNITSTNQSRILGFEFVMPDSATELECIIRPIPPEGSRQNALTFTGIWDTFINDRYVSPGAAGFALASADNQAHNVTRRNIENVGTVTKTYTLHENYFDQCPDQISITAPDLPSSLSACEFDHWVVYRETDTQLSMMQQSEYEPSIIADRTARTAVVNTEILKTPNEGRNSIRLVPVYRTPTHELMFLNLDGSADIRTVAQGAVKSKEYSVTEEDVFIKGMECMYAPSIENVDSYGNIFRGNGEMVNYNGYTFTPSTGSVEGGTCTAGTMEVRMPNGNVAVRAKAEAPKYKLTMTQSNSSSRWVEYYEAGTSPTCTYSLLTGERVDSITIEPEGTAFTVDENRNLVTITEMPKSDVTVNVAISLPEKKLKVTQGSVYLNGSAEPLPRAEDGIYLIPQGTSVLVKPDAISGRAFKNWDFEPVDEEIPEKWNPLVTSDGRLFFIMPTSSIGLVANYDEARIVAGVHMELGSALVPGASLPLFAVVEDETLLENAVPVTWTRSYGEEHDPAVNGASYTATFTIAPAEGSVFLDDMEMFGVFLYAGNDGGRCENPVMNADGSVTASYTFTVPALQIAATSAQNALEGVQSGWTTDEVAAFIDDNISKTAVVTLDNGKTYNVPVQWDMSSLDYDPTVTESQTFEITGTLQLNNRPFVTDGNFKSYAFAEGVSEQVTCTIVTSDPDQPQPVIMGLEPPTANVLPGAYLVEGEGLEVELASVWNKPATQASFAATGDNVAIKYTVDVRPHEKAAITSTYDRAIMLTPGIDTAAEYVISCYAVALKDIQNEDKIIAAGTESDVATFEYSVSSPAPEPNTVTLTVINGTGSGTFKAGQTVKAVPYVPFGCEFGSWTADQQGYGSTDRVYDIVLPDEDLTVTANFNITDVWLWVTAPEYDQPLVNEATFNDGNGIVENAEGEGKVSVTFTDEDGNEVPAGATAAANTIYTGRIVVHTMDNYTLPLGDTETAMIMIALPDGGSTLESAVIEAGSVPGEYVLVFTMPKTDGPTPDPGPGPGPDPGPGPGPGPGPDPDPGPTPGPEPDPGPTPGPEPDPGPTPGPTPDPEPQPEPGPTPTPDPSPSPSNPGADSTAKTGDPLMPITAGAAGIALLAFLVALGGVIRKKRMHR